MRFKKVEISAFRIYDKPADATFDFTLKTGKAADFISLYAPNGFGKTSFYDAVEWGMTDNIQRFWQNELFHEAMTSQKGSSDEQVKILRNTFSTRKTPSYVKITTDTAEQNRVLKAHGNKKWDIADSDSCENRGFRKVILSQEWISAFLKEVDGEKRLALFMDNPDLAGLNAYYRNLTDLINANAAVMATLNTDLAKEKENIVEIKEGNLLESVNASIASLHRQNESLSPIKLTSTNKEALDLIDKIAARQISIAERVKTHRTLYGELGAAMTGNQEISGVDLYFEHLQQKEASETELKSTDSMLVGFTLLDKSISEIKNLRQIQEEHYAKIDDLEKLQLQFSGYRTTVDTLNQKEKAKLKEQEILTTTRKPLNEMRKTRQELRNKNDYQYSRRIDLEAKLKNFPTLKLAIDSLQENLEKCDVDITLIGREISAVTNDIKQLQQEIKTATAQQEHVNSGDYGRLMKAIQESHPDLFVRLLDQKSRLSERTKTLNEIDQRISQQESFNKELEAFIKMGLDLINQSQTDICPLCNQGYESYKTLAGKVAANNLLDSALQDLIKSKTLIQTELNTLKTKIAVHDGELRVIIDGVISALNTRLSQKKQHSDNLNNELKLVNASKSNKKADLDRINKELGSESQEDYVKKIESEIADLQRTQEVLLAELKELENKMAPLAETEQVSAVKIKLLEEDIAQLRANPDYLLILDWFRTNEPNTEPSPLPFTTRINQLKVAIVELLARVAELEQQRERAEKELAAANQQELLARKKVLTASRETLIKAIANFETYISRFGNMDTARSDKDRLVRELEALRRISTEEIARQQELDTVYQTLSGYAKNLLPFLRSENARLRAVAIQEELKQLEKEILPILEAEKKAVRKSLEEKIESFFYTGLINQIYNKIDPHPEFKAVEFKANFDAATPTLDVFVTNGESEQSLVPNLYFSSAQINILSLSIFLASALNSPEYDCIFIDDPVQSMDSINVLSTIDLFRSIIVNENKQIILSTHDSNFHNLLKKKMPPHLFDSKFLELESFGKVKVSR